MGKRRCPNWGKRAPDGVVCCPTCGHSVPIGPAVHVRFVPTPSDAGASIDDSATDQADERGLVVAECPACGRQAQRGWKTCPWCHVPLPAHIWQCPEPDTDSDEDSPWSAGPTEGTSYGSPAPIDEDIDDPELLERAEEDVRRLPLRLPFTEPLEDPRD